jgi:hypothetical protein
MFAMKWALKAETRQECVTAHQPNELASKMSSAQSCYPSCIDRPHDSKRFCDFQSAYVDYLM